MLMYTTSCLKNMYLALTNVDPIKTKKLNFVYEWCGENLNSFVVVSFCLVDLKKLNQHKNNYKIVIT